MSKKKNFMDFVTANPPAFVPGQTMYWLDPETGEIRKCTNTKKYSLVLTSDWEWKLIDPEDENFITIDEDPYYCTTKKRAKEFRDKLGILTYVVLEPAEDGTVVADDKRYKFFKQGTLDASTLLIRDTFFTRIMKNDPEIKEGMIIKMTKRDGYLILPGGKHDQCYTRVEDVSTRILIEEVFTIDN